MLMGKIYARLANLLLKQEEVLIRLKVKYLSSNLQVLFLVKLVRFFTQGFCMCGSLFYI